MNVLLLQDPDATKVAAMPLKYSKKAALEPLSFYFFCLFGFFFQQWKHNICSGACGLPELGSNCYIALTERRKTQPRVFVISEVCSAILQANIRARGRDRCLDICCQTKSHTLPREQGGEAEKKIPNFASNYLPTSVLQWEVIMAVNHAKKVNLENCLCLRAS